MKIANKPTTIALITLLALAAPACTPTVDQRGNLPHPEQISQIKPGASTRDDVLAVLGTPSATMNYGGESWHYIATKTETTAFFEPKTLERQVVSIVFDDQGMVKDVVKRQLEDGKDFQVVDRVTPTAGKELSILEQLIGNIGRFSKPAAEN